jgi:hypothetical protein
MSTPVTYEQALTEREFHEIHEPAGKIYTWRRNGATQTWKTRPGHFRIPVKYGLKSYGQITHTEAHRFHAASDCHTRHVRVAVEGGEFFGIVAAQGTGRGATAMVHVTTRGASKHKVGSRVEVRVTDMADL